MKALALVAIRAYQRFVSPRKGFACAWRVRKGGASCSAFGLRAIERHGVVLGLRLLDRRLKRCGQVHREAAGTYARLRPLRAQRGDCDCACDLPSCDGLPCDCDVCDVLDCCDCDWPWRSKPSAKARRSAQET